jgi:hypothetical protein
VCRHRRHGHDGGHMPPARASLRHAAGSTAGFARAPPLFGALSLFATSAGRLAFCGRRACWRAMLPRVTPLACAEPRKSCLLVPGGRSQRCKMLRRCVGCWPGVAAWRPGAPTCLDFLVPWSAPSRTLFLDFVVPLSFREAGGKPYAVCGGGGRAAGLPQVQGG